MTKQLDAAILVLDGTVLASFQHKGTSCCSIVRQSIVSRGISKMIRKWIMYWACILHGVRVVDSFILCLLCCPSNPSQSFFALYRIVLISPEREKLVRCSSLYLEHNNSPLSGREAQRPQGGEEDSRIGMVRTPHSRRLPHNSRTGSKHEEWGLVGWLEEWKGNKLAQMSAWAWRQQPLVAFKPQIITGLGEEKNKGLFCVAVALLGLDLAFGSCSLSSSLASVKARYCPFVS